MQSHILIPSCHTADRFLFPRELTSSCWAACSGQGDQLWNATRRPALECNEETSSGMQRSLQVQCFKKTECSAITNQSRGRMYHHNPSTARELHPYSVNSTNQFLRGIMKIIFRMYLVKQYPDPIAVH